MFVIFLIFLLSACQMTPTDSKPKPASIVKYQVKLEQSQSERKYIPYGKKLYLSGKKQKDLIHWYAHESYPTLGYGSFRWACKGTPIVKESHANFADILEWADERGRTPPWLDQLLAGDLQRCPWTRAEFNQLFAAKGSTRELMIDYLDSISDLQMLYPVRRYNRFLAHIAAKQQQDETYQVMSRNISKVYKAYGGPLPLIDYLQFMGEGLRSSSRYGLSQVLVKMEDFNDDFPAVHSFSSAATFTVMQALVDYKGGLSKYVHMMQDWAQNRLCKYGHYGFIYNWDCRSNCIRAIDSGPGKLVYEAFMKSERLKQEVCREF